MTTSEKLEMWDASATYVVGHQRPDTDAIASVLGYAWYLTEMGHSHIIAARTGQPGEQTTFALKRFEIAPPRLLTGVAPTFGHVVKAQPSVSPDAPLPAAMTRVAEGDRIVPVVDANGKPTGMVTPLALARAYTAPMNVTQILAQPCQTISEPPQVFAQRDRISDHRSALLRSDGDDFLVVNDAGIYIGVATRRRILEPPRAKLILVDHNELSQAVADADEAEIVAVLDHHRLGNPPTALPIPFVVEPVGSTCTLVAEHCREQRLLPSRGLAGIMLSGILSDTLVFRSPTTTDRDRFIGEWLAHLADVDIQTYGSELLYSSPGLTARPAVDILETDRKSYIMGGQNVSISQIEVTGLQEVPDRAAELLQALDELQQREALALACLMITDVVTGKSEMLCKGESRILSALPFARLGNSLYDLEDMVSRKKQLVPTLHAVLEDER